MIPIENGIIPRQILNISVNSLIDLFKKKTLRVLYHTLKVFQYVLYSGMVSPKVLERVFSSVDFTLYQL